MKLEQESLIQSSIDFEGNETVEALIYTLATLDYMGPLFSCGYDIILIRNHPSTKLLYKLVNDERMRVHNMLADRIKDA